MLYFFINVFIAYVSKVNEEQPQISTKKRKSRGVNKLRIDVADSPDDPSKKHPTSNIRTNIIEPQSNIQERSKQIFEWKKTSNFKD